MVGMATAAVVARGLDAPSSASLWIGAFIASGVPDLDLAVAVFGLKGPRFHRNASHALPVIALGLGGAWLALVGGPNLVAPEVFWVWCSALVSHPLLDVLTTGPIGAGRGYGIPLWWPLSRRRWFLQRPVLETADFGACRSARDVWEGIRPEIYRLGPVALAVFVLAVVVAR
jgi:membrane-bound metal-dependent hydrolase YbcI (DUF457 family)